MEQYGSEHRLLNVVALSAAGSAFDAAGLEAALLNRIEPGAGRPAELAVENRATTPAVSVPTAVERPLSGAATGVRAHTEVPVRVVPRR